jgi:hypothetical protein
MNDQIAIQYALYRGMQSCALFQDLNPVLGREYLAQRVAQDAVWQTPAPSGKVGAGAIIQIPTLLFPKPNSLQRERIYSIGIYEEPNRNFTPAAGGFAGGTMRAADDWADVVLDFMWNWRLWRAGGLVPETRAVVPDDQFAEAGIIGMRAVCVLRQERQQPARCATPQIAVSPLDVVTLTVADGSDIWYTLDGFSSPSPATTGSLPGETAAAKYAAPFQAQPGTIIMCAAWPNANTPNTQLPSQTNNQSIS